MRDITKSERDRWDNVHRLKEINSLKKHGWYMNEIADHFSISESYLHKVYRQMKKKFSN